METDQTRTVRRFAWLPVHLTGAPWFRRASWVHLDWYEAVERPLPPEAVEPWGSVARETIATRSITDDPGEPAGTRTVRRFAWLPVRLDTGRWLHLDWYDADLAWTTDEGGTATGHWVTIARRPA